MDHARTAGDVPPIRKNVRAGLSLSLKPLCVDGVHSSHPAAKVVAGHLLAAFIRHEHQRKSVGVIAANPLEARTLRRALTVPKCVESTKTNFNSFQFGEGPHIEGKRSHAESVRPEMDRAGVRPPEEQIERHLLVAGENDHSVLPEDLVKVQHGLVKGRRAIEVATERRTEWTEQTPTASSMSSPLFSFGVPTAQISTFDHAGASCSSSAALNLRTILTLLFPYD
jgi:hypothetical protein